MSHHRIALLIAGAALALDASLGVAYGIVQHIGIWHGVYCAVATAVTVGGDVNPTTTGGYIIMTAICLTVVPLFGAAFSLVTSALASANVQKRLDAHHKSIHGRLDEIGATIARHHDKGT